LIYDANAAPPLEPRQKVSSFTVHVFIHTPSRFPVDEVTEKQARKQEVQAKGNARNSKKVKRALERRDGQENIGKDPHTSTHTVSSTLCTAPPGMTQCGEPLAPSRDFAVSHR
jgi:hypothetical protein